MGFWWLGPAGSFSPYVLNQSGNTEIETQCFLRYQTKQFSKNLFLFVIFKGLTPVFLFVNFQLKS